MRPGPPLPTNPVWCGSMHAISSYRDNRPTHTPTNKPSLSVANRQDRLQYTALQRSAQCYERYLDADVSRASHCGPRDYVWSFRSADVPQLSLFKPSMKADSADIWNSIPDAVRYLSVTIFKSQLKTTRTSFFVNSIIIIIFFNNKLTSTTSTQYRQWTI